MQNDLCAGVKLFLALMFHRVQHYNIMVFNRASTFDNPANHQKTLDLNPEGNVTFWLNFIIRDSVYGSPRYEFLSHSIGFTAYCVWFGTQSAEAFSEPPAFQLLLLHTSEWSRAETTPRFSSASCSWAPSPQWLKLSPHHRLGPLSLPELGVCRLSKTQLRQQNTFPSPNCRMAEQLVGQAASMY